ncbi:hypothetical protein I307_05519 [Cryptococcus deuterogattii 99/473]|uniref:Uncharacterized protein n=1 Tax=Cryptococcus deuterogattii Ram5 TaxID=1296110 RepID=A0A0D0UTF1_9TREE|nr:hypothetical protein I309_03664 [Cryptococcus deuterogattii LA55]KIR32216.1 hypothetical protein I352_05448 [Cryptococcus deuterogattii MMRL2647]KIR38486.1 hypothetical protein I313_05598 [Cryptococcus deuterogattii Ram5]KIR70473.1 hypothetical protein I310_05723 [Cryptococcus deuterogattii CA1014]KIR90322.1 hypothetical protein I304_05898 [Cryptococcus deuterogattii CBS 10090]KIR97010.1 hypothetical protein L804_05668 [Cryptococcus deuterogattii 2001/935-1]KIY55106.1 hypothetical protein 
MECNLCSAGRCMLKEESEEAITIGNEKRQNDR